jgi:hypothetical protein
MKIDSVRGAIAMMQDQTQLNPRVTINANSWYEIRVGASLAPETVEWIGDFSATKTENGQTILIGEIPDQPALFGVLLRVRDLCLPLISLNLIDFSVDTNG